MPRRSQSRRDIDSLLPADRGAFFKAVRVLYETSASDGRARYGANFRSMDEVWAAHALLGGDGESHELLGGTVGADAAAGLLEKSKPHRVPTTSRGANGHRL